MMLGASKLCEVIRDGSGVPHDGISVTPCPNLEEIERSGGASISLRLGRWFLTMRQSGETHMDLTPGIRTGENKLSKRHFVPFGSEFILHPGRFVLASTLEWLRLPSNYAGFVVGKSSLGRRGIIIETAPGVHPGFSGCLTLEIANVGEIPVSLIAGQLICQVFFHTLEGKLAETKTQLSGQRKPRLGQIRADPIMERLIKSKR